MGFIEHYHSNNSLFGFKKREKKGFILGWNFVYY